MLYVSALREDPETGLVSNEYNLLHNSPHRYARLIKTQPFSYRKTRTSTLKKDTRGRLSEALATLS